MTADQPDKGEQRLIDRMLFFSDAIFAIAMTLLILELRPPFGAATTAEVLSNILNRGVVFGMSFALVAAFWAGHLSSMRRLIRFDWLALWANLFFLFTILLMPFASAMLGAGFEFKTSWTIYCTALVTASVAQTLLAMATMRDNGRLMGGVTPRAVAARLFRTASPGIAFGMGLALLFIDATALSQWCWLLVFPLLIGANMISRDPKRAKAK
ncbi:MAG: TMEM175 family protein [Amphiplicatus sp.]